MSDTELIAPAGELDALTRMLDETLTVRVHGEREISRPLPEAAARWMRAWGLDGAVQCRTRQLDVLDTERKTVARLEVSELAVRGRNARRRLGTRTTLVGLRGYEAELASLRRRLCEELAFTPAPEPVADATVRALGHDPAALESKVSVALEPDMRSDAAAAAVLRALLVVIEANIDGAVADIDPEFLHDLRVSVRRSRAVQRQLKAVFGPDELRRHRAEFRWLQQVTGELRDLDVQLEELGELRERVGEPYAADLAAVAELLAERRDAAQQNVARTLRGRRVRRTLAGWAVLLEELVDLPLDERPRGAEPIVVLAGERIAKLYRKMIRDGRQIDVESPDEELHELRKRGKELRYMLELFAAELFDPDVVGPMVKSLKALQDVLGRHQDRHVQIELLRSLTGEMAARDGGAEALVAIGAATVALRDDALAARQAFAERFAAFAAKRQRRMVREVFAS